MNITTHNLHVCNCRTKAFLIIWAGLLLQRNSSGSPCTGRIKLRSVMLSSCNVYGRFFPLTLDLWGWLGKPRPPPQPPQEVRLHETAAECPSSLLPCRNAVHLKMVMTYPHLWRAQLAPSDSIHSCVCISRARNTTPYSLSSALCAHDSSSTEERWFLLCKSLQVHHVHRAIGAIHYLIEITHISTLYTLKLRFSKMLEDLSRLR